MRPTPPVDSLTLAAAGVCRACSYLDRWQCTAVFLDSMGKRAEFRARSPGLAGSARETETSWSRGRKRPLGGRNLMETFDLVTARSFGPPAVTAECAAQIPQDRGSPDRFGTAGRYGGRRWSEGA